MRLNVYCEEITSEVDIVQKGDFKGVRIYLYSSDRLHDTSLDDDRSAVTFWIPQTRNAALDLEAMFGRCMSLTREYINTNTKPHD